MDAHRADLAGVPFFKMTGSGNDFVFLDGRVDRLRALETAEAIQRLCARGTGIGADGVVWLTPATSAAGDDAAFRMRYRNSDGSIADMCGNASLCSVALATHLGLAPRDQPFSFLSDAGVLRGRLRADGLPEVVLTPVKGLVPVAEPQRAPGEAHLGFADSGVPHLVVHVDDAELADVLGRGRALRNAPELGAAGANVNFVSPRDGGGWRMRTYERGVEGETLACGTGAAATAALLAAWGLTRDREVPIETTSGRTILVSIREEGPNTTAALAGEGRIVFEGVVVEL